MSRTKSASRGRKAPRTEGPVTRADRLAAIGAGEDDPCANHPDVLTRAQRLDAIGAGEDDPVNDLTDAKPAKENKSAEASA